MDYLSCESSEPKGDRMYGWTKAGTARVTQMSTVVGILGKSAGMVLYRTLRENQHPNTVVPVILLTQRIPLQQL